MDQKCWLRELIWKDFKATLVREKVILRVVLVCVENGVGVAVQDKLGISKSLRRPWSGGQNRHYHFWFREMSEDDTKIMLHGGKGPTVGEGNF